MDDNFWDLDFSAWGGKDKNQDPEQQAMKLPAVQEEDRAARDFAEVRIQACLQRNETA